MGWVSWLLLTVAAAFVLLGTILVLKALVGMVT
jgi:hypothetical protein